MNKRCIAIAGMVLATLTGNASAAERLFLPLSWATLVDLSQDWTLPHEGQPEGVPADYDWAKKPRLGAGNDPGDFTAFTGWGQVFSATGGTVSLLSVSIRDVRVLVCHGPQRDWMLLQQGEIEGAQFRPDYEGNLNTPPVSASYASSTTSVRFRKGLAYHFWPKQGRVELPRTDLCGIVVLLQARTTVPLTPTASGRNGLLLGLGADYWRDRSAPWDNYQSNQDVAIGRLRWVNASWRWFGMSTASIEDLRNLHMSGYAIAAPQAR